MLRPSKALTELNVLANFAEVYLAKFGHQGRIGINLLEKIQLPTLPALFGAMLAGVDFVLIGAGIPRQIPAVLDSLSRLEPTQLRLDVSGAEPGEEFFAELDPRDYAPEALERLNRPQFIAIVSSTALATTLVRKCSPPVDGLVIEGPTAGGHNAPPRGTLILDDNREPIYGAKDLPDLEAIRALGVPFWLAGSYGSPEKLREAIGLGATGIQVGTAFAFCEESGITPELKREVLQQSAAGTLQVFTDSQASPTGFPFKVIHIDATLSEPSVFEGRTRICDLGYLRQLYRKEDGTVGYRCPGEPIDDFVAKGGNSGDCSGRKCLCNGLMATVGLGQVRKGVAEPPIVTAGDDAASVAAFLPPGRTTYNAGDVLDKLLGTCPQPAA
ncbi:MAG: hypothetical protein HONBIEJF_00580 [Fimbriimonadaceae bacterium]|nr:hypothetical protein [Fimbriimonadaceae bacterium]